MTTSHDTTPPARRRVRWAAAPLAAALVLALGLAACGGDDDDDATSDTTAADTGGSAGGATLKVTEIQYSDVSAPAGGKLTIENTSGAAHTFTADDGEFDVSYGADETVEVDVPAEPGEYPFHCEIHPSMTATLTAE
jgi:plastocyanin